MWLIRELRLKSFFESSTAFVLHGFEVLPLRHNLLVYLEFGIAFGIFISILTEARNEVVEKERVHAAALVFGFNSHEH